MQVSLRFERAIASEQVPPGFIPATVWADKNGLTNAQMTNLLMSSKVVYRRIRGLRFIAENYSIRHLSFDERTNSKNKFEVVCSST